MENNSFYSELFNEFCAQDLGRGSTIKEYKPWGANSIVVWFMNGQAFKIKRIAPGKFVMQKLSEDDIKKKFSQL